MRICKDAFRVAGAAQDTCSSEMLGGPGADVLRGIASWSIRSSGLLRSFSVTGAALRMTWHHFFHGRCNALDTLDTWTGKIAKRIVTRPSALHSTFHYWRKSRRVASFLLLRFWCCQLRNRSLGELFRFWPCQVEKLRKSRKRVAFLMLLSSRIEEVSQNSFGSKLADGQIDR